MASKQVIAVDIDDVVFPLVPNLIQYLDSEHKVKLTREDFVKYDIRQVWEGGPEEAMEILEKYKNQPELIEVAPLLGAKEALDTLSNRFELIVMTSRDASTKKITEGWLTSHFPEIFKNVHLLGNRHDSQSWRPKSEVCVELGVFCLIDDNLTAIKETNAAGVKTLLFGDYPWNQADELPNGVTRVKNWQEVLEYFDEKG